MVVWWDENAICLVHLFFWVCWLVSPSFSARLIPQDNPCLVKNQISSIFQPILSQLFPGEPHLSSSSRWFAIILASYASGPYFLILLTSKCAPNGMFHSLDRTCQPITTEKQPEKSKFTQIPHYKSRHFFGWEAIFSADIPTDFNFLGQLHLSKPEWSSSIFLEWRKANF